MQMQKPETVSFAKALENGKVIDRGGYHQPDNYGPYQRHCGCKNVTDKGAYRDMTIKLGNTTLYYYHQNLVVAEANGIYYVSNAGYETSTTKERINRYLPNSYYVRQIDFEWYLETDENQIPFENGMILSEKGNFVISP